MESAGRRLTVDHQSFRLTHRKAAIPPPLSTSGPVASWQLHVVLRLGRRRLESVAASFRVYSWPWPADLVVL